MRFRPRGARKAPTRSGLGGAARLTRTISSRLLAGAALVPSTVACTTAAQPPIAPPTRLPPLEASPVPAVAGHAPAEPPDAHAWAVPAEPHDASATRERLLSRLQRLSGADAFALGHEDTTAYGVGWTQAEDRSDVQSICGSHAGVYGWDLFRLEKDHRENGDGVDFARLQNLIRQAYEAGGINTISWHADNPVTGGDAWDTTPAVAAVLPGGTHHELFQRSLGKIADYLGALRGPAGERIPILFRPFHEHTGDWFWWGSEQTDEEGYVRLFRFTVDFLRGERGLDNLLFAFSPDGGRVFDEQAILYRYPGDEYVDVIGLDYYFDPGQKRFPQLLRWLVKQATAHGKIPALTEFGPRGGVNGNGVGPRWLSTEVLRPLLTVEGGLRIAYALAWRNASPDHAFYPYPGHAGEPDLKAVCEHPAVLLTKDLKADY